MNIKICQKIDLANSKPAIFIFDFDKLKATRIHLSKLKNVAKK